MSGAAISTLQILAYQILQTTLPKIDAVIIPIS